MGTECVGEFTVYKRAGSPHHTVIGLKISFCSATYRPKAHRPIYRDLGALVHSKYLYFSVQHIALIVGAWSRSSSSGSTGEQQSGAPDASRGDGIDYYKTGLNRDARSDAPIPRKQPSGLRDKRRSVGGGPRVRIHLPQDILPQQNCHFRRVTIEVFYLVFYLTTGFIRIASRCRST